MFTYNSLVDIKRGATFGTTVVSGLSVYIYDQNDTQDAMGEADGSQIEKRMITIYAGLKEGDKVTAGSKVYIIKRVKERNSIATNHYEIILRCEND